jgi:hypothetical protein
MIITFPEKGEILIVFLSLKMFEDLKTFDHGAAVMVTGLPGLGFIAL